MYNFFFVLNAEVGEKLSAAVVSLGQQGPTGHINTGSTNPTVDVQLKKKERKNICRDSRYNFTSHQSSAFLLFLRIYKLC